MTNKTDINGLVILSGLGFRAAQGEMATLLGKETALRQNLEQLTLSRQNQAQASRQSDDPALISGADIRWHRWVDKRRTTINTELAQILAEKEICRTRLARAFGRDQAAQALLKNATRSQRRAAIRRQTYES